jgi:hypothetical protein
MTYFTASNLVLRSALSGALRAFPAGVAAVGATALAGVFLFGCASASLATPQTPVLDPFQSQSKSEAQVCAIQTKPAASKTPDSIMTDMVIVRDNGDAVAAVRSGGYACFFAQPGKHVFLTEKGASVHKTKLSAEAGRRYYLDIKTKPDSTVAPRWVDESTAKRMLQFTSPSYGEAIAQ